jgi:hypothetical protein
MTIFFSVSAKPRGGNRGWLYAGSPPPPHLFDNSILPYVPSSMIPRLCIPNKWTDLLFFLPFSSTGWPCCPDSSRSLGWRGYRLGKVSSLTTSSLTFFFLGTSGCPSGDWDRGLTNPRFSLQPRRPNKKFPRWRIKKTEWKIPKPVSS